MSISNSLINIVVISDVYVNTLGLLRVLNDMDLKVRSIYPAISSISSLNNYDAIICDINLTNQNCALEEIKNKVGLTTKKVIFFSDGVWVNKENYTFIHRAESIQVIKGYVFMGIFNGYGVSPKLTSLNESRLANISIIESFVLKKWFQGTSLSDISRLCNKSIKTISCHKRNAMKKMMIRTDYELYKILTNISDSI